ncbi:MAG: hypothetical protein WC162_10050 [Sphaerochaetaceae bacterium]
MSAQGQSPKQIYDAYFHVQSPETSLDAFSRSLLNWNKGKTNVKHIALENFTPKQHMEAWNGNQIIKFGLIGDTHINSKYTQLTWLHKYYDEIERQGIPIVYHAGDIGEGEHMRTGHEYEIYTHGVEDQVEEITEVYPRRNGTVTEFITGNHDASVYKISGCDVGKLIARQREDMLYLGRDCVVVNLTPNCTLELRHPWDGTAYALSYKPQKMIEAMEADSKPNILGIGHYHKSEYLFYRNIHCFQVGCFLPQAVVTMADGSFKKICHIQVGDKVLSHTGNINTVTNIFKRKYSGTFHNIKYGRNSRWQTLTATEEHPILVMRNGVRIWEPIKDVRVGDYIMVKAKKCSVCGNPIPYYLKMCSSCNPAINQRKTMSESTNSMMNRSLTRTSSMEMHFQKDILPFCYDMKQQGWNIVPVSTKVIPDAIGFKDGKVVLFELERLHGAMLEYKQSKYNDAEIMQFADSVEWIDCKPMVEQPRSEYVYDNDDGFVWVPVLSNEITDKMYWHNEQHKSFLTVYNLEVENDHTYLVGNVAVHNCFQGQTPFTRGKGISVHLGGWIITIEVNKKGYIQKITPEFIPFYYSIPDDYKKFHRNLK